MNEGPPMTVGYLGSWVPMGKQKLCPSPGEHKGSRLRTKSANLPKPA